MLNVKKENSLALLRPDIALEWDCDYNGDKTPYKYSCHSHEMVFWKCSQNHIWPATIKDRTRGSGCPYCKGKKVLKGFNDFESKCSEKMYMWDYEKNTDLDPSEIYYHSGVTVWWRCKEGHSWPAKIKTIADKGKCPFCNKTRVIKGKNDLESLYPEVCEKWDYELNQNEPSDYFPNSGKFAYWCCKKGHKWKSRICTMVRNNTQCAVCSKRRLLTGVNDFATLASKELLEEWDYERNDITPDKITAHNKDKECFWKCKRCGEKWGQTVEKRFGRGFGCPFCSGKKVRKGKNDLASLCPDLVEWWSDDNSKRVDEVPKYSSYYALWKCPICEGTFNRCVRDHVKFKTCPFCTGFRVTEGKNDLATKQPLLIQEWNYKKNKYLPEHYSEHSNKKVWWVCLKCRHEWPASINNRSGQGRGCPKCNGK